MTEPNVVSMADVIAHAKPGCKWCHGRGAYNVVARKGLEGATVEVCNCAARRFLRRNPDVTHDPINQTYHWPQKTEASAV
jgi:hypothetical protein